jgi:8-oxo-dGTP pyrophosphatase MutT (NUDIX family)
MSNLAIKVLAYITHQNRLLIFSHPDFPEAGLQVPAGSVEPGETLAEAVLREADQETGLSGLKLIAYLGSLVYDMSAYIPADALVCPTLHQRHFFHLALSGPAPTRWQHYETSGGQREPILFELFWVGLDQVPELTAGQGEMLGRLQL